MSTIDYMKVIDLMAKTLRLEKIDVHFPEKSIDKIEAVLGGDGKAEKKFRLSVAGYSLTISFPKSHMTEKEYYRWLSAFEYELEQTFLKNISIHADADAAQYLIKISI